MDCGVIVVAVTLGWCIAIAIVVPIIISVKFFPEFRRHHAEFIEFPSFTFLGG